MKTKVLIIDDEQEFASALKERLVLRGYDARTIFRPEEVLSSVTEARPDVVLLDLGLEGVNGMDILRKIKASETGCTVIVLTGLADDSVFTEACETGAADVIVKPIDITLLVEHMNRARLKTEEKANRSAAKVAKETLQ